MYVDRLYYRNKFARVECDFLLQIGILRAKGHKISHVENAPPIWWDNLMNENLTGVSVQRL